MNEQISMFALLDEWETPLMQPEEMKEGVTAWVIEMAAITNSIRINAPIQYCLARGRKVKFTRDSKKDKEGRWDTFAKTVGGTFFEWYGGRGRKYIFRKKPTWNDLQKYVMQELDCWKPGIEIRPWPEDRR